MAESNVAAAVQAVQTAPAVEATPPAQSTPQADPAQQAFARKERQLRKLQQEVQAERTALDARAKQYETDYIPKSRLLEDPMAVLTEQGIGYDQITQAVLAGHNTQDPAIKALRAEIKRLADDQEQNKRTQVEQQQAQYTQAIGQIRNEVKLLVDGNSEFESIKAMNLHDAVVELIEQTFSTDGYLMDITEAAKEVEMYLLDEAVKLSQLSKVQARLKAPPAPAQSTQPVATDMNQQAQPIKTLTNAMSTAPTSKMSNKDRRARAIAAFQGNKG